MAGGDSSKWSNLIRVGTSSCATLIRSTVVPLFSPPLFSCLVGRERERERVDLISGKAPRFGPFNVNSI